MKEIYNYYINKEKYIYILISALIFKMLPANLRAETYCSTVFHIVTRQTS